MKVKLKFKGLGIYNEMQAMVKVWNKSVCFEKVTYNGEIELELKSNSIYHLRAVGCSGCINIDFYVDNKNSNYIFYFPRCFLRKITFQLRDKYYPNLSIEKGELLLWQIK